MYCPPTICCVLLSPHSDQLIVAVPVAVVAAAGGFFLGSYLNGRSCKNGQVNTCVCKDSPKVVHSYDMEDIGTKAVYCRCWKSKKVCSSVAFVLCLHVRHIHTLTLGSLVAKTEQG